MNDKKLQEVSWIIDRGGRRGEEVCEGGVCDCV